MLQFRPYNQNRPSASEYAQQWGQDLNNIGSTAEDIGRTQQQQQRQAMLDQFLKQEYANKQQDYQRQNTPQGQLQSWNTPGAGDLEMAPGVSGPQSSNPLNLFQGGGIGSAGQPNTQQASAGVSDTPRPMFNSPSNAPQSSGSPVLDHWNNTVGKQYPHLASAHVRTEIPGLPSQANDILNDPNLSQNQVSQKMGMFGTGLDYQGKQTKMGLENAQAQADLAKAKKDLADAQNGGKSEREDKKRWDNIVKDTDPYKASSRSPIGMAQIGNLKADHVIPILKNPNATNQDIEASLAGLDTVLQGGAATQSGIHSQEYVTLASKWANLKTLLTSQPQAVATPEIKNHLVDMLSGLKDVNNRLIKDHLDYIETAQPDLIQKNSAAWQGIRKRLNADQPNPGNGGGDLQSAIQAELARRKALKGNQ